MTLKHWKKLSGEDIHKNPWCTYRHDKVLLPTGKEGDYFYVHTHGSVIIIPVMEDGSLYMVKQYRYLEDRISLEFPAGGIKSGEIPEDIAHKELAEETNYDGRLAKIGVFNPCNGLVDETAHVYIARDLFPFSGAVKDETEEFEHAKIPVDEFENLIAANEIKDGMTMAAWLLAKNRI